MTISIVREQETKFDERGHCISTDARFVKISVSFRDMMQVLKGARLSAFLVLALNEAEMSLGQSSGLTVYQIAESIGYGVRATIYALQFLCERNFATKLEQCGDHGESVYRVSAYAWFGDSHAQPRASNTEASEPAPASNRGYAKIADLAGNCRGVQKPTPVVVGPGPCIIASSALGEQQQTTGARETFLQIGIAEPALSRLSSAVAIENADAWRGWLDHAPSSFRDPVAYMVKRLREDPQSEPPEPRGKPKSFWCEPEFLKYVHGRPEHREWLRENPDQVHCSCLTPMDEGDN